MMLAQTFAATSSTLPATLYGDAEEAQMDRRLEAWVQHHLTPQSRPGLPRTRAALLRALRVDLGSLRRQVVPAAVLFKRLVLSGHIEVAAAIADEENADKACGKRNTRDYRLIFHSHTKPLRAPSKIKFDEDGRPIPVAPREDEGACEDNTTMQEEAMAEEGFATRLEAEEVVVQKAERWAARLAAHPRTQPTSIEVVHKILAQLAVVNVGYPPERLLRRLEERGYLRFEEEHRMQHNEQLEGDHPGTSLPSKVVWLLDAGAEKRKAESTEDDHNEMKRGESNKKKEKKRTRG